MKPTDTVTGVTGVTADQSVTVCIPAELMAKWKASAKAVAEEVADTFALMVDGPIDPEAMAGLEQNLRQGALDAWAQSWVPKEIQDHLIDFASEAFAARLLQHILQPRGSGSA